MSRLYNSHIIIHRVTILRNPVASEQCFTVDHTVPVGQSGVTQVTAISSQSRWHVCCQVTCAETGPWLGIGPDITVVDTPGFGGDMEEEEDTIDGLVNFLREDLMYVDAFVIAFKQSDSRPTVAYRTMIKLIDGIFGDELWDHVMIEATWWSYSLREVSIREQKGLTEAVWLQGAPLTSLNNIVTRTQRDAIEAVYIDTFYMPEDPMEKEKFEENTQMLRDFAQNKTSFHCKDISIVKTELRNLEEQKKMLEVEKIKIETRKNELNQSCSNKIFELKNNNKNKTLEIKTCQEDRAMIKAEKLRIEDQMMDEGLLAVILAGCVVAGLVIGALVTRSALKYFGDKKSEDDDEDDDDSESESSEKEMIENVKSKKKSLSSIDEFTDLDSKTFNSNIIISKV